MRKNYKRFHKIVNHSLLFCMAQLLTSNGQWLHKPYFNPNLPTTINLSSPSRVANFVKRNVHKELNQMRCLLYNRLLIIPIINVWNTALLQSHVPKFHMILSMRINKVFNKNQRNHEKIITKSHHFVNKSVMKPLNVIQHICHLTSIGDLFVEIR